jgi:hypothetical protein
MGADGTTGEGANAVPPGPRDVPAGTGPAHPVGRVGKSSV